MRDEGGVGVVADYYAADSFCAAVGVECVVCEEEVRDGFPGWCYWSEYIVPCSSTSCRCPGFVRSATVLLNSVMNSP
jgi:hypothetical protein